MAQKPRSKKSEALEIRVSHEEKQAFMDAVSTRGTTASTVLREAMDLFVRNGRIRRRNIMITSTLIAVSAGALVLQGSPDGETQTLTGIPEFTEMDTDGNRLVSIDEFRAHRGTARDALSGANGAGAFGSAAGVLLARYSGSVPPRFGRMARETPGQIGADCWAAMNETWQQKTTADHSAMDADGDGYVSVAEFSDRATAQLRRVFNRLDRDASGSLDANEVIPVDEPVAGETDPAPARNLPDHVTICFGEAPVYETPTISAEQIQRGSAAMMTFLDLDGDGAVSWQEYRTSMDVNLSR